MEEYFLDWLNNDTYFKSLATIKLYVERNDEPNAVPTNAYLQYLAVCFMAAEIVRKGKGEEITDINVARSMIFNEEDNDA